MRLFVFLAAVMLVPVVYGQTPDTTAIRQQIKNIELEIDSLEFAKMSTTSQLLGKKKQLLSLNEEIRIAKVEGAISTGVPAILRINARMRTEKLVASEVIKELPKGSPVIVFDIQYNSALVKDVQGQMGWIQWDDLESSDVLKEIHAERLRTKKENRTVQIDPAVHAAQTEDGTYLVVQASIRKVNITWAVDGNIRQIEANAPWVQRIFVSSSDSFVSISAQNMSGDAGLVTVAIYRDGHLLKSSDSRGKFVIASTNYSFK
jgi:hypothetical protein